MIETIQGNHEFYEDFILHRYESMDSHIQNMSAIGLMMLLLLLQPRH